MNISINNNSFRANVPVQKMFSTELTGNRKALVKMTFNDNRDITALETIISDSKNKLADGKAILHKEVFPLKSHQIAEFFELLRSNAEDGLRFTAEFFKAMKS